MYCGFVFFAIEALSVDQLLYPATYIVSIIARRLIANVYNLRAVSVAI